MSTIPTVPEPDHVLPTAGMRLRSYFLTGIIVAGPLTVTAYIVWWFINLIDGWVKPLLPAAYLPDTYLPFQLPGFGLIVAFLALTMLGFLTANLVGRYLLKWSDLLLARMPLVSGLYKGIKQVFETVFSQSGTSFRKVGLVQFPQPGMWSLVFISAPATGAVKSSIPAKEDHISVFLPCTPNPTTGFFFYLPVSEIVEIDMAVDTAAKLIMSAGLIQPEEQQAKLAVLAKSNTRKSA
jgi:uncharacterized membrane protein